MRRTAEVSEDEGLAAAETAAGEAVTGEELAGGEAAGEDFAGFDGTWDFAWIPMVEEMMEQVPWTWIAVIVFVISMIYSFYNNRKPKD